MTDVPPVPAALTADNLLTAARRLVRFVRVDDERSGGLLSQKTVEAADTLWRHVEAETRRLKREGENA